MSVGVTGARAAPGHSSKTHRRRPQNPALWGRGATLFQRLVSRDCQGRWELPAGMRPQAATAQAGPDEPGEGRFQDARFAGGPRHSGLALRTGQGDWRPWRARGVHVTDVLLLAVRPSQYTQRTSLLRKGSYREPLAPKCAVRTSIYTPWNMNVATT